MLTACAFEAPEAPTFQTQVVLPFPLRTYTIEELIEGTDGVIIDSSGIRISQGGDIDAVQIDDELTTSIAGVSFSSVIGSFSLEEGMAANVNFAYSDLAPGAPTGSVIVPPFPFDIPEREVSGLNQFSEVTFATGDLIIEATNELPVPISGASVPPPGFALIVRNGFGGEILVDWVRPDEIEPGETVSTTVDMAGKTMGSTITVAIEGASNGSDGQFVDIVAEEGVSVEVRLENVTASSATAQVPEQRFGDAGTASWSDSLLMKEAAIDSGRTTISLQNATPLDATLQLRFPDFFVGTDTLSMDIPLAAGASDVRQLDFAGARFLADEPTSETSYAIRVRTEDTGDQEVLLSSTDSISVTVGDIDLRLAWVEAVTYGIETSFGPYEETFEWPDEMDPFTLGAASLMLTLQNEIGTVIDGEITIEAFSDTDTETLVETVTVQAGALDVPVVTEIVLDESNSNILDLLAIQPTRMEMSGTFEVRSGQLVRMDRTAEIGGSYGIEAPFEFEVTGGAILPDPSELGLDEDTRSELSGRVTNVRFEAKLTNGFPFGASATLVFGQNPATLFDTPDVAMDPVNAPAARVNQVSGKTEEPTESVSTIILGEEAMDVLLGPDVYMGVQVDVEPTDGVVVVSPDAEVAVRGVLVIDLTVDE